MQRSEGAARNDRSGETAKAVASGASASSQEKATRTAAHVKLDSHLVLALKKSRSEPPFDKPTALDPDLAVEADGRVLVDLDATVSPPLLARIEGGGGTVINNFAAARAIRALVPLNQLEALAADADVRFISPAVQATTNRGGAGQGAAIQP